MERTLWTLGIVAFIALCVAGFWWGWRRRGRRQEFLPELPAVPDGPAVDLIEPIGGMYVSSTIAGRWQDRVVARGLGRRARAELHVRPDGVLIDRDHDEPVFIPTASLRSVGTAPGIAGKVVGQADGILVLTWELGGTELDSGIRSDDPDEQVEFITAVRELIAAPADKTADEKQRLDEKQSGGLST
jgi:hypothetical protein